MRIIVAQAASLTRRTVAPAESSRWRENPPFRIQGGDKERKGVRVGRRNMPNRYLLYRRQRTDDREREGGGRERDRESGTICSA